MLFRSKSPAGGKTSRFYRHSYVGTNRPSDALTELRKTLAQKLSRGVALAALDIVREPAERLETAPRARAAEEAFHPRFVEALQKQAQVEYLLDVLLFGETEEKADLITDYGKDVIQLEQRMAELAAADAARTKKHYERHAAAPER